MAEPQITPADIASYQAHVGRTLSEADSVGVHLAARMAATLDRPPPERDLPALWHYGLFQPTAPTSALGHDGHPRRGDFMPPVSLPRRMFAGSDIRFLRPLAHRRGGDARLAHPLGAAPARARAANWCSCGWR